jgi:ATPase subunit of ABC transporter with duplicated ATPase domains
LDEEHIEWLRRYLQEYENAFILISHDIPFLNSVVNLIYHMGNKELNRYVGDYDNFMRIYDIKKKQLEAAYKQQQNEIAELEDFVQRNKARVSTRNMAMSRQKKLDKMEIIELAREKPKQEFNFKTIFEKIRYEPVYLTAVEIKKFLVTIQQIEKQKNFDVPFLNELFMSYRCILQQFGLSLSQQDLFLEDKKQSISHHKEGVVV